MRLYTFHLQVVARYVSLLVLLLVAALFGFVLSGDGYDPARLHIGYMYVTGGQFVLFSVFLPFLVHDVRADRSGCAIGWRMSKPVIVLIGAALPIYAAYVVMWGRTPPLFSYVLVVEASWGLALSGIQQMVACRRGHLIRQMFTVVVGGGSVLIGSLCFLYAYVMHEQAVITTIFDKDIPLAFFSNPLLVVAGLLYEPIGGNQWGIRPLALSSLLWTAVGIVAWLYVWMRGKKRREARDEARAA
ncbi:hypothetical protein JQN58_01845 [Aneurinibacillus sp. BA2021]|nr:hypothetical protein [Aneurinibacillus sp. BA2021]